MGKLPLAYDLQEPFRCLIDIAVINGLEKGLFTKKDFVRTENYNLRLRPSGAKKLMQEIESVFNKRVSYRMGGMMWCNVINMKAQELAHYILGKKSRIDFSEPKLELNMEDDFKLRQKILSLSQKEAKEIGIGKSSLHYLRKHAKNDKSFKVYEKVKEKLVN